MTIIKVYKLLSGQEIIGTFSHFTEHGINLTNVRDIAPQSDGNGGWRLTIAPFVLIHSDSRIDLYHNTIVCDVLDVPEILQREYLSAVSGIQIVTAGNLK